MEDISDRISTVIRIKNLSNAEFAQSIGVQPSNISHILSGRNKPSLDLIMKILRRYPEIRLDWLVLGKGAMNEEQTEDLFSSINEKKSSQPITKDEERQTTAEFYTGDETPPAYGGYKSGRKVNSEEETEAKAPLKEKNIQKISQKNTTAVIEKVIVLYSDRTFEEYFPR